VLALNAPALWATTPSPAIIAVLILTSLASARVIHQYK
jgi:hypothetical protein